MRIAFAYGLVLCCLAGCGPEGKSAGPVPKQYAVELNNQAVAALKEKRFEFATVDRMGEADAKSTCLHHTRIDGSPLLLAVRTKSSPRVSLTLM